MALDANINNTSGNLKVYSSFSIIDNQQFYFTGVPSSSLSNGLYNEMISISANDSTYAYTPVFDVSPPDLALLGNNFFTLEISNTTTIITIPDGNYSPTDLVEYLNTIIQGLGPTFSDIIFILNII